ncbi:MAG: ABC transporter permease subunit [Planctomycetaceae bacterium]
MRSYLAVLKDSFREAFASKILWLTLGLIAVFLAAIAPLSLTPGLATELQPEEIRDGRGLLAKLQADAGENEPSPGKHLWSLLSESDRERLQQAVDEGDDFRRGRRGRLRRGLNGLLTRDDFYEAQSWDGVKLDEELAALAADESLAGDEQTARNRRLLAAAFPDMIRLESEKAMYLSYFTWKLDTPIPFGPERRAEVVNGVVSATCAVLLGFLGIFISILVTASLVPRTFEAGEISLLLSKPVLRPLLFLTRFVGGCAFTLLNAVFLMGGLWLVIGLRFDVWNHRLLLCIPIYLFLFLIYFAVSATAGALWRSPILAIGVTLVFWFALFLINVGRESVEQLVIAPNQITDIVPIGDSVLAVNESREFLEWSATANEGAGGWSQVFRESGGGLPRVARRIVFAGSRFRPTYDAAKDRILAVEPIAGGFGSVDSSQLLVGYRENDWQRESAGRAPAPIHSVFIDPTGRVILVGLGNIFEFTGDSVEMTPLQQWVTDKLSAFVKTGNRNAFRDLRPDIPAWTPPFDVAMDPETGDLAVYSDGNLTVLSRSDEGPYVVAAERADVADEHDRAMLAVAGDRVLLAVQSMEITLLNRETLEDADAFRPFIDDAPLKAVGSPDGRYVAVLSDDEHVWCYDVRERRDVSSTLPSQGDIHAVAFEAEGRLLLADRISRVRSIAPGDPAPQSAFAPPRDFAELAYHYFLMPLYTVLPKPNELNQLVADVLTGDGQDASDRTLRRPPALEDPQDDKDALDLWTPLWSNLAFLALILGFACWHVTRRDF